MSVRQQIVDEIQTALQGITVFNGYNTDAGQNVFVWLDGEPLVFPALILRDTLATVNRNQGVEVGRHEHRMIVEVAVKTANATSQAQVRSILEDVVTCLWANRKWNGLARVTNLTETSVSLVTSKAEGLVKAEVVYHTDLGQI